MTDPPRADSSARAIAGPVSDTSQTPAAAGPRDTTGTLRIGSELPPGATVTIDGVEAQLDRRGAIKLTLGDHQVVASAPGFQPAALTITIEPGSPQRWDPVLRPAPASPDPTEPSSDSASAPPPEQDARPPALPPDASGTPDRVDSVPTNAPADSAASASAANDAAATAIRAAVAGYASAIEGRSIAQMRQRYPEMPRERQDAWRSFFTNARDVLDVEVELTASDIDASGTSAEAVLNGTITFEDDQSAVHTVRYDARATLRSQRGRWHFVEIAETRTEEP